MWKTYFCASRAFCFFFFFSFEVGRRNLTMCMKKNHHTNWATIARKIKRKKNFPSNIRPINWEQCCDYWRLLRVIYDGVYIWNVTYITYMLVCCVVRYGVCDMMNDIFGNKKRRKMQFIQLSVWMRWLAGRLFPTRCLSFLSVSPFPSFPIYHSFFFPSLSLFFLLFFVFS